MAFSFCSTRRQGNKATRQQGNEEYRFRILPAACGYFFFAFSRNSFNSARYNGLSFTNCVFMKYNRSSICVDDKGQVYIGTSNRDWNPSAGYPKPGDDHILQIIATDARGIDKSVIKEAHTKAEVATGCFENL